MPLSLRYLVNSSEYRFLLGALELKPLFNKETN